MSDSHRFFLAASEAGCDSFRSLANDALGYPNSETESLFPESSALPRDSTGKPAVAVDSHLIASISNVISNAIQQKLVSEISRSQYTEIVTHPIFATNSNDQKPIP